MFRVVSGDKRSTIGSAEAKTANMTHQYTFDEKELEGYEEISKDDWMTALEVGDYIKYTKVNKGKAGAFINAKSVSDKRLFLTADKYKADAFKTIIGLDKIDRIWRKVGTTQSASGADVQSLARAVAMLAKKTSALEDSHTSSIIDTASSTQIIKLVADVAVLETRMSNIEFNIRKLSEKLNEITDHINGDVSSGGE